MKSNFPKIYSLSTIGIIHHYNCDYRFHKTRTDFTGESGSGKSMIADMIQAIFVGSGVYESSTKGNDDRPLEGMVLKPKGKQFGIGYIFLNIQIAPKQYIVIGIYIESSSRHAQSFIIQSGYNWDGDISTIAFPVYYKDLLVNDKIVPIERLPVELQKRNLILKSFSTKTYHQLLFDNHILPINLASSGVALDSYANILRSFSRGKGFKKDSDSLKDFLFGNDDEDALMLQYKTEVKSISDDYRDHSRYKEEIDLINKKQNLLKDILERKNEFDKKEKDYLTTKILYCINQEELLQKELDEVKNTYVENRIKQYLLEKRETELVIKEINKQHALLKQHRDNLGKADAKTSALIKEKDSRRKIYEESQKKKNIIDVVEQWSIKFGDTADHIRRAYSEDKVKKDKKEQIEIFTNYLEQNKIKVLFEQSEWIIDFQNALKKYDEYIISVNEQINSLEALQMFSDLNNPDSLAGWAINHLKKALTIEEESILMHFQCLSRTKPIDMKGMRYLPFPENLFSQLTIKDVSKNGFWLDLDGVYEFIAFVPKQNFKTNNFDGLRKALKDVKFQVDDELRKLNAEKNDVEQLKTTLFKFTGLEKSILLYKDKRTFSDYEPEATFTISEIDLNIYIKAYENKDIVLRDYRKAQVAHESAISEETKNNQNILGIAAKVKEIEAFFQKRQIDEEDIIKHVEIKEKSIEVLNNEFDSLRSQFGFNENKIKTISSELFQSIDENELGEVAMAKSTHAASSIRVNNELIEGQENFNKAKDASIAAKNDYQIALKSKFIKEAKETMSILNPDDGANSLKNQFEKAQAEFKAKYDIALEGVEERSQLEGSYNLGLLAHKLLPSVFESSRIDENLIDQKIADRLESVSRTIKEIGSRKVEILKKVFTEVYKTYNKYLTKITQIDNYFKTDGKVITGGNRASLKHKKSNDYPDKWMAPFRKQLDEQLIHTGLFEQLLEEVDINAMMVKAFTAAGGSEKVTPEDLLNPKSYFDLTFDLKLESGDNNAGSSGQTYTATALLGIARLSLIEEDENGKKRPGLRFMPIDEAEGLGSNYNTLCDIAKKEKYQIISMSIEPAGELKHGEQFVYIMNENPASSEESYIPPFGIFSEGEITENIGDFVYGEEEE